MKEKLTNIYIQNSIIINLLIIVYYKLLLLSIFCIFFISIENKALLIC